MIDLDTFADAATLDLGPPEPKPTSLSGDQMEAAKALFTSEDGLVEVGVWECTPGHFTADRTRSSEICHIISGRASLARKDGEVREVGPGDVLVLPKGWTGAWTILETTRKLYVIHRDAA
ncbi:cupin domain-containing protein [Segnochrobactrum spirostomi]|uniref:Cupin domain-containing protein n=1 Tax=Segnochrobactrum spirostomi TaxID=2608987 RepID=A0A6A7YB47_9HYPH|nr:cupin domain-containing protein [Segnochrobactrum spirostomi]MQT14892.1 cupin domain-containing protein [Segnochrobactrum spirostomi]